MKHALYLPPFGELADPRAMIELAVAAEAHGWDGVFLWDHVLRPAGEPEEIADPWILLAAMAAATSVIRLGPMVTPLVRRRPHTYVREALTLDQLADGRLTLGLGLGVDAGGELSRFGELVDARARGDLLDEGAALVAAMLSGETVTHHGDAFTVDGVRFLPRSVQRPRIPLWFATRGDAVRPVRRAAQYDGVFPIEVDLDQFDRVVELVRAERGTTAGFDFAVLAHPGVDLPGLAARGATWAMWSFLPGEPVADVLAAVEQGPDRTGLPPD